MASLLVPSTQQELVTEDRMCDRVWYLFFTALVSVINSAGGIGTVTNFSFNDANGFTGSVSNPTTTPELTLTLDEVDGGSA